MKKVFTVVLVVSAILSAEQGSNVSPKGSLDIHKREEAPPSLTFAANLIDLSNNAVYIGGDEIILPVTITNSGKGSADGVRIVLSGSSALADKLGNEQIVGSIAPGTSFCDTLRTILPQAVSAEQGRTLVVKVTTSQAEWSPVDSFVWEVAIQPRKGTGGGGMTYVAVDIVPDRRTTDENAVAVVIGISKYLDEDVPEVAFAEQDAARMRDYLENVCGVKPENVIYKLGAQATKGVLEDLFNNKLPLKLKSNSTVYIYFAGHGTPGNGGQPYLIPADGAPGSEAVLYPISELVHEADGWKAQKTLIMLDICFAGSGRVAYAPGKRAGFVPVKLNDMQGASKTVVITASDSTQSANDLPEVKHGLFTYCLLEALQGAADNNPKDGWVSLGELYDYVRKNVSSEAANKLMTNQDPVMIVSPAIEKLALGWRIAKATD